MKDKGVYIWTKKGTKRHGLVSGKMLSGKLVNVALWVVVGGIYSGVGKDNQGNLGNHGNINYH